MRSQVFAAALGLLALGDGAAVAQTTEAPAPAVTVKPTPPDTDLKAKIQATQKARDELIQKFEAESAKKGKKDAKRDAEMQSLSGTVCSGCGTMQHTAPTRRKTQKQAAPKPAPDDPEAGPIVNDLY